MTSSAHHLGQRLSLKSQLCTVRYIGPVADKAGEWLGVEWDDPERGKHNGTHAGVSYFTCRSNSLTAASFLRPEQPWDKTQTFLQALKDKYAPSDAVNEEEVFHVSASKRIEEVGYEKLARRQAQLQGIRTIVLDGMRMRHDPHENALISKTCENVTILDISRNLFETLDEILALCGSLPNLSGLTLDGNRFSIPTSITKSIDLDKIQFVSLSNTLLDWDSEVAPSLVAHFSNLDTLIAQNNQWTSVGTTAEPSQIPHSLFSFQISENVIFSLDRIRVSSNAHVRTMSMQHNRVSKVRSDSGDSHSSPPSWFETVEDLDVRHNDIISWSFINEISSSMPNLRHLRVTGNPLYQDRTPLADQGSHEGTDDFYMLTIARLPGLKALNYSIVTDKERLNAETYYLNKIAAELKTEPSKRNMILEQHPRWNALCEMYGEPGSSDAQTNLGSDIDSNSLAARLVFVSFHLAHSSSSHPQTWVERLPKSLSVYSIIGVVAKRLDVRPQHLRLTLETDEKDPIGRGKGDAYAGPEWWDSDEEETGTETGRDTQWVPREVSLGPGTRAFGTYVDGPEAKVRVEVVQR